ELPEHADVPADHPDHRADGEPDQERAVAVLGAVPGPEPDDPQAGARRGDHGPGVGGVPRRRLRPGPGAVAAGRPALPQGAAGDLRLSRAPRGRRRSRRQPRGTAPQSARTQQQSPALGRALSCRACGRRTYCDGLKLIVRRVVTGTGTGSKRQRRTALSASRSKVRGGLAWTTRAEDTEPSRPTVNSIWTSPEVPARSASGG